MDKMKLIPVKVPWRINASCETEKYSGNESNVNILLYGECSQRKKENTIIELNKQYNNIIPDEIWNNIGNIIIDIKFECVSCFCEVISDCNTHKEEYDTSLLTPYADGRMDFRKRWKETDICPNPNMYEVENSKLKKYMNFSNAKIKHWLIMLHDEEIHILARNFTWKEISND